MRRPLRLPLRLLELPVSRAGRALLGFWAVILLASLSGAAILQWLGPPARQSVKRSLPAPAPSPHSSVQAAAPSPATHVRLARAPPIAAGARRIAILLDGIGLSEADSLDAITQLPAAISLAVSPYSIAPEALVHAARKAGHEVLLSLPMEPAGAPLDDEGRHALTGQVSPEENRERLQWSLSRIGSYSGVTNAFVSMRGERFAASAQFDLIMRLLSQRGLFYLDATPDQPPPPYVASADADLTIDDPPDAGAIDHHLNRLEQIARERGSAIGIAGPITPVTVERLANWARALPADGFVLVPVGSLVHEPHPGGRPHVPG